MLNPIILQKAFTIASWERVKISERLANVQFHFSVDPQKKPQSMLGTEAWKAHCGDFLSLWHSSRFTHIFRCYSSLLRAYTIGNRRLREVWSRNGFPTNGNSKVDKPFDVVAFGLHWRTLTFLFAFCSVHYDDVCWSCVVIMIFLHQICIFSVYFV